MDPVKKLIKQAAVTMTFQQEKFAKTLGITGTQMSTIDFLSNQENNAADQKAIESEFGIKRSTTTIMLQRMENHDLIKRIVNPDDKRKKQVQLTDKALLLVDKIKEFMKNDDLNLTRHFSDEEIQATKKVLNYVKAGGES